MTTAKPPREPFLMVPKALAARRDLHAIDKLVWAEIRNRIGANGKCWPGGRTLATDLGVNRDTILASIDRLECTGDLGVERRGNGRGNHYTIPEEGGRETRPVGESNRRKKPARGGRKIQPEAAGKSGPNKKEPLNKNQGEPATPPAADPRGQEAPETPPTPPDGKGAGGRLVAAWVDGFKAKTGEPFPESSKGKLAGTIKRLAGDYGEPKLTAAIDRWFGVTRADYGVELFAMRLAGGAADLLGRSPAGEPASEWAPTRVPTEADIAAAFGGEAE